MKKLITIIALTFSIGAWAEEDMISLNEYMDRQVNLDSNNLYYVFARCSAINYNVNALSKNSEKFKDSLAMPSRLGFEKFYVEAGMVLASISGKNIEEDKKVKKLIISIVGSRITTNLLLCLLIYGVLEVSGWLNIIHRLLVANT